MLLVEHAALPHEEVALHVLDETAPQIGLVRAHGALDEHPLPRPTPRLRLVVGAELHLDKAAGGGVVEEGLQLGIHARLHF